MIKKNILKIINWSIILVSLILFVLCETKVIDMHYPWHSAVMFAIGAIGIVYIFVSISSKKLTHFYVAFPFLTAFFAYFLFVTLAFSDVFLGIVFVVILAVALILLRNLFDIRSDFSGDNKAPDYENYKERRKKEALEDISFKEKNEELMKRKKLEIEALKKERDEVE